MRRSKKEKSTGSKGFDPKEGQGLAPKERGEKGECDAGEAADGSKHNGGWQRHAGRRMDQLHHRY